MKPLIIVISVFFSLPAFCQPADKKQIFSDTSVYFIAQRDSLNPVQLSPEELAAASELFSKAIDEFNKREQRWADSLNPKENKRKQQAQRIDADSYFFRLIPYINKNDQKTITISGTCKGFFDTDKRRRVVSGYWKHNFIDGSMIEDGGSCFIYIEINLTGMTTGLLGMNGEG